jgi:DNA polymerase
VILALGRSAAYAVLGQEASIQTLRGRVHYRQHGDQKIPVVVTYHPAYLLRQPAEKWKVWQDLLMADST